MYCVAANGATKEGVANGISGAGGRRDVDYRGAAAFNPWGIADMYGNVWEWTRDARTTYDTTNRVKTSDCDNTTTGGNAVLRGGSYSGGASYCSSAGRNTADVPGYVYGSIGARLARVLQ